MTKHYFGNRVVSRRDLFYAFYGFASFATLAGCSPSQNTSTNSSASSTTSASNASTVSNNSNKLANETKVVRLGSQVSGDLTRIRGAIEKRLNPLGVNVTWAEFASGPPLLEALNVGSIDLGPTGETPPIFAQAAGADLVYLVNLPPGSGQGYGIIVPKDSSIQTVADLKGKKVAYARGTALTYFLIKALEEVGLKFEDIVGVNLGIADGRAAFLNRTVDAYVATDPYLLKWQQDGSIRLLRDAQGIKTPGSYYLASRKFATNNPETLKLILDEYNQVGQWANQNRTAAAELLAPKIKIDVPTMELLLSRRAYEMRPITDEVIKQQQEIADLLYDVKIVPKKVDIREAILTPQQYVAITPDSVLKPKA